jgi:hypothetical protein
MNELAQADPIAPRGATPRRNERLDRGQTSAVGRENSRRCCESYRDRDTPRGVNDKCVRDQHPKPTGSHPGEEKSFGYRESCRSEAT